MVVPVYKCFCPQIPSAVLIRMHPYIFFISIWRVKSGPRWPSIIQFKWALHIPSYCRWVPARDPCMILSPVSSHHWMSMLIFILEGPSLPPLPTFPYLFIPSANILGIYLYLYLLKESCPFYEPLTHHSLSNLLKPVALLLGFPGLLADFSSVETESQDNGKAV